MAEYWKLDRKLLRVLITEKELKRWWVAENTGVHKTTLRRWMSGRIRRVQHRHLSLLAHVLDVPDSDIAERCG